MDKLLAALAVLRYGSALTDPEIWKKRQLAANALIGLLAAIAPFLPVELSHEDQRAIAGGIAAVGVVLNIYLTAATSKKVGLPSKGGSAGEPGADEGRERHPGEVAGS